MGPRLHLERTYMYMYVHTQELIARTHMRECTERSQRARKKLLCGFNYDYAHRNEVLTRTLNSTFRMYMYLYACGSIQEEKQEYTLCDQSLFITLQGH